MAMRMQNRPNANQGTGNAPLPRGPSNNDRISEEWKATSTCAYPAIIPQRAGSENASSARYLELLRHVASQATIHLGYCAFGRPKEGLPQLSLIHPLLGSGFSKLNSI